MRSTPSTSRFGSLRSGALLVALLAGCGGSSATEGGAGGGETPGSGTTSFFTDVHKGGEASSLRLLEVSWGRLVDVYSNELDFVPDLENPGELVERRTPALRHREYLIGQNILSDGVNYLIETNPVTGVTSLTLLYDKDLDPDQVTAGVLTQAEDELEAFKYQQAFADLIENLGPVQPKGLSASEIPPFSFMPRNAALMLRFSDLLDHTTIRGDTVRLLTGYPPSLEYFARVVPDSNHGDLVVPPADRLLPGEVPGTQVFRSTRVIVDTTISETEAAGTTLVPNSLGLPASITITQPNVALVVPTEIDPGVGQFMLLSNLSGTPVDFVGNGPTVEEILSQQGAGGATSTPVVGSAVVRSMRAGGELASTGDKNNGFLLDLEPPRVLGHQRVNLIAKPALENPGLPSDPTNPPRDYLLSFAFQTIGCALQPEPGDAIELPGGVVAIVRLPAAAPVNGVAAGVPVQVLGEDPAEIELFSAGVIGTFVAQYEPSEDVPLRQCFFEIFPKPVQPPSAGVATSAQFTVRFSEPMDPVSVSPFDTYWVGSDPVVQGLNTLVVGRVFPSADLREFVLEPVLPMNHGLGNEETYFLSLFVGDGGVRDLAGNNVAGPLPAVTFRINSSQAEQRTSGVSLRFGAQDEDGDGLSEVGPPGQVFVDPLKRTIRGRPVSRLTATADRSSLTVGIMIPFAQGVQTPLSPLGSRMMTLWRYCDFNWSSTDASLYNVDIERLHWTPVGGQVSADVYEQFEMLLGHSKQLPDEEIDPNLLPKRWKSGLLSDSFDINILQDPNHQMKVVHPRQKGYLVDPSNVFTNTNGVRMIPWPYNDPATTPLEERIYYTFRDTGIQATGGKHGSGLDPEIMVTAGLGVTGMPGDVAKGDGLPSGISVENVPTIGLPLLMEFRCFPAQDTAVGLNSFDISIAINSSSKPNFRLFSTGGFNTTNSAVVKNPDTQPDPTGGFNPTSSPAGKTTPGDDPSFYIGQAEIVVRVTRVFTHWLAIGAQNEEANFEQPVVEFGGSSLPAGTSVVLEYRGATSVEPEEGITDAASLDAYGDLPALNQDPDTGFPIFSNPTTKNPNVQFLVPGDYGWKGNINQIDGSTFFQARITFISNAATELVPELSALGVAFRRS